jgi:hypothetical protein
MTFNVTLNSVELNAEQRRARAIRARELLDGMSWLFDEYIAEQARDWLAASTPDVREIRHARATVAAELKAHLLSIVDRQMAEERQNERRTGNDRPADHA